MPSFIKSLSTLSTTAPAGVVVGKVLKDDVISGVANLDVSAFMSDIVNKWDLHGFDIQEAINLFSYEGFDPKIVYRHLLAIQAAEQFDEETMNGDVALMLTLQHVKGNITVKNFKSLKPEAQNLVNMLFTRWNIVTKIGNEKKRSVTLPRLAAAFPLQSSIISRNFPKDFVGPFYSAGLPHYMKTSSFGSLVPIGRATTFLLGAYNMYATDQSLALKQIQTLVMDESAKQTAYEEQYKYTVISNNSVVMSMEGRRRSMIMLNVKDDFKAIEDVLKQTSMGRTKLLDKAEWDAEVLTWVVVGATAL